MDNRTITSLTDALDFGSARMQAISNNLSNVNTPGYKRQDVSFAALLDAANGAGGEDDAARSAPTVVTDNRGSMRPDGNNVDVDAEGARLAATEIYYQSAAQLLQGQFSNLKYVIGGGK